MSPDPTRLHFSAFQMVTPGSDGAWRAPGNTRDHLDLRFWQRQAQLLEGAGFDALFFADILGVFETRESGIELSVRDAHVFPLGDPFVLVSALASVTERLGFVVTASTTYEPPFLLARRFSTLDHLTRGRIGWNIVTSYLDTAAANFGLPEQVEHGERYVRADEYVAVVEKLWLRSWDRDAVVRDAASGVYVDPAKVAPIDHDGPYFRVRGPHQTEPSPQGKPVFFQATGSPAGRDFAARHAEALYTSTGSRAQLRDTVADLRRRAAAVGRPAPVVFAAIELAVADTDAEARDKLRELSVYRSEESALAWNGIDIRAHPRDTKLSALRTFGTTRPLRSVNGSYDVTIAEYVAHLRERTSEFAVTGSPATVADQLVELAAFTGVDGFSIGSSTTPGTYEDFAQLLTPVLRDRGLLPAPGAEATTLRARIRS